MPDEQPAASPSPGRLAYDAYGNARSWKTATGFPMPAWDEQLPELRAAWDVAGAAAGVAAIRDHLDITKRIRAWQVDDKTVVAAETAAAAVKWYLEHGGGDAADVDHEPHEVAQDYDYFEDETRTTRFTVARAIAECLTFPCILLSTDW